MSVVAAADSNGGAPGRALSGGALPDARPGGTRTRLAVVENEFASVTVSLDSAGHSPRLHVQDNETGDEILLSAIELASLCLATEDDRAGWLRVGLYRGEGA
ncbi:MAG TPA: hypothetical protein VGG75_29450 [Trebonia sp.]|jgi:hypothetical protein